MKHTLMALVALCAASAAHADNLVIEADEGQYYLGECGKRNSYNGQYGTVEAKITKSGDLNFILRNVTNCSNFDIIGDDGYAVRDYKEVKIPSVSGCDESKTNCPRTGSFTVPASLHDFYWFSSNTVTIVIQSNSKKTSDRITVEYEVE